MHALRGAEREVALVGFDEFELADLLGITVVRTSFQHNDMRDTGPDEAKASIQQMLEKMLDDDSPLRPIETNGPPEMTDAGPVAPYGGPVAHN